MKKTNLICDKCGAEIEYTSHQDLRFNSAMISLYHLGYRRSGAPQRIDLCPECYLKFITWLENQ